MQWAVGSARCPRWRAHVPSVFPPCPFVAGIDCVMDTWTDYRQGGVADNSLDSEYGRVNSLDSIWKIKYNPCKRLQHSGQASQHRIVCNDLDCLQRTASHHRIQLPSYYKTKEQATQGCIGTSLIFACPNFFISLLQYQ